MNCYIVSILLRQHIRQLFAQSGDVANVVDGLAAHSVVEPVDDEAEKFALDEPDHPAPRVALGRKVGENGVEIGRDGIAAQLHQLTVEHVAVDGMENMIPQDSDINRKDYKALETELAKEVAAGKEVYVKVEPIYEGDSHRPVAVMVTYTIDGEESVRVFPNEREE